MLDGAGTYVSGKLIYRMYEGSDESVNLECLIFVLLASLFSSLC